MSYILSTERIELLSRSSENQVYSGDLVAELASKVQLLQAEIERLRKIVEVQKVEIEQLQKSHANSNLLSTLIPDHTKDILDGLRKDTWKWTESEEE